MRQPCPIEDCHRDSPDGQLEAHLVHFHDQLITAWRMSKIPRTTQAGAILRHRELKKQLGLLRTGLDQIETIVLGQDVTNALME